MRIGRLVWWRRAIPGLAAGVDGRGLVLRRRRLLLRLRGPVAVLAGVPLLSLGLVAGAASVSGAAAVASASGVGIVTMYPSISNPRGITAGPDGALWFTNDGNNSIGRITTTGTVSTYTGTGIDDPQGITAAPGQQGALWFTNLGNNSIGRITTSGAVTNYTGAGIEGPEAITTGPDGALWFTSAYAIGRITAAVTPAISGFTPASGAAGTIVTITGQNLSATSVAFDGTPATIVSDTATKIVAKVPSGAATGPITVTTPYGTATSDTSFTVT
jgi:streptogramin lyase